MRCCFLCWLHVPFLMMQSGFWPQQHTDPSSLSAMLRFLSWVLTELTASLVADSPLSALLHTYLHKTSLVTFLSIHSPVCESSVISLFFFDWWGCVPVLLVVWCEAFSTGVCRQLRGARFWCWHEDIQETLHRLIYHRTWSSLLVQYLGLSTPTTGAQAWPLAWEIRPWKPRSMAKKKKEKKATNRKEQNNNKE